MLLKNLVIRAITILMNQDPLRERVRLIILLSLKSFVKVVNIEWLKLIREVLE